MKRYVPVVILIVFITIWIGVIIWKVFLNPDTPTPPDPDPTPITEIIGPQNVKAGDLVVYTTGSKSKFTQWDIVPYAPQIKITNGGQVLVIVFDQPGKYHIILASSEGNGVELVKVQIAVGGEGPDPPRPPPIPPNPGPNPDPNGPDAAEWTKWAKASVAKMEYRGLKTDVTKLSGQLSSYAAQIAAGAVDDVVAARVRIRQITNSTLGKNTKYWLEFSGEYAERTKEFSKLKEYQVALKAMAEGLDSAADSIKEPIRATNPYDAAIAKSDIDKRPVLVVITSKGCPACRRLESEWLPNTKAYGDARVVVLDRSKYSDVVETISTRGMKGRIVVPQVHILRYIDGDWRQFSRVGYSDYGSEDRWVRSVFTWEDKP